MKKVMSKVGFKNLSVEIITDDNYPHHIDIRDDQDTSLCIWSSEEALWLAHRLMSYSKYLRLKNNHASPESST